MRLHAAGSRGEAQLVVFPAAQTILHRGTRMQRHFQGLYDHGNAAPGGQVGGVATQTMM